MYICVLPTFNLIIRRTHLLDEIQYEVTTIKRRSKTSSSEKRTIISIVNHTLLSTVRAVIGTLTCTSMASNSTSNSECY